MHEDSCAVRGYGGKKLTMTHHIASSKKIRIAGPLTKPFEIEKFGRALAAIYACRRRLELIACRVGIRSTVIR